MILRTAALVPSTDAARYAWAGLARFQNVAFVEEQIYRLHGLDRSHRQNVKKQARQIRYALIQAKEYFDAAAAVTLATKPNLLYYSVMSLAIAEILLKQSGESSLDAARKQHRHHGLILRVKDNKDNNLEAASAALVAEPLIHDDQGRVGTFELWHRSCREMSLCGVVSDQHPQGGVSMVFNVVLGTHDERLPMVPQNGLSLLDCLRASPGMMSFLPSFGIIPDLVRGKLTVDRTVTPLYRRVVHTLTIHPAHEALIQGFFDNIRVRPDTIEHVSIHEFPQAGIITVVTDQDSRRGGFEISNGSMWRKSEIRFWPTPRPLNEFGYLYVALYIVGNYARYYPDKWLLDVEQNSPLALAVEELMYIAEQRMALLAYSELSRIYQVLDD